TSAKLDRVGRIDDHYPYGVAIFFAKERHGAELQCLLLWHLPDDDGDILPDLLIDEGFDCGDLVFRHFGKMREIETKLAVVDQGSLLGYVRAQHLAQGRMEQVGGGVMDLRGLSLLSVDGGDNGSFDIGRQPVRKVDDEIVLLFRVENGDLFATGEEGTGVAY